MNPPPNLDRILHLKVPVIVILAAKQMEVSDVLALTPGMVIEFSKPADEPLFINVNNRPIARGEAVRVGERFGVQIKKVATPQETARALGK